MPRPRKNNNKAYPIHFQVKGKACYHVFNRRWTPIGSLHDLPSALQAWAKMEHSLRDIDGRSVAAIAAKFTDYIQCADNPLKWADKTRIEKTRHLRLEPPSSLIKAFGDFHIDTVRSHHIAEYLDAHPSKISANREVTTFSRLYRWAIRKGYTAEDRNPCLIDKNPEKARDRYIEDAEYLALRNMKADFMQCMMDISLLTAWRLMTVARIKLSDWDDNELQVVEGKTKIKARVEMTPVLMDVLDRAKQIRGTIFSPYLFINRKTHQAYTENGIKSIWRMRMNKALRDDLIQERFTFHDIRAKHASDRLDELSQLALGHTDARMTAKYIRNKKGRKYAPLNPRVLEDPQ